METRDFWVDVVTGSHFCLEEWDIMVINISNEFKHILYATKWDCTRLDLIIAQK